MSSNGLGFAAILGIGIAFSAAYTSLEQKGELPSIFTKSAASETMSAEPPRRRVRYVYTGDDNNNDHSNGGPNYHGGLNGGPGSDGPENM